MRCPPPGLPSLPAPRARRPAWFAYAALACWALAACGDDEETAAPDDGRYRPPMNGIRISEEQACTALQSAFRDQALALQCSSTSRPCPDFLRTQYGTPCMEYDQGTVAGCVEYYQGLAQCSELDPLMCVVTPYPDSAPAGCPP